MWDRYYLTHITAIYILIITFHALYYNHSHSWFSCLSGIINCSILLYNFQTVWNALLMPCTFLSHIKVGYLHTRAPGGNKLLSVIHSPSYVSWYSIAFAEDTCFPNWHGGVIGFWFPCSMCTMIIILIKQNYNFLPPSIQTLKVWEQGLCVLLISEPQYLGQCL